jgi:hydroxyacylglutathione hydrolase
MLLFMEHVVRIPPEVAKGKHGTLEVHGVPAWQDNLVWLIVHVATGECAAVDGPDATAVLAYVDAKGLRLTTILNTHTHGDHVGINRDLERRGLLASMRVYGAEKKASEIPGLTHPLHDGDRFELFGEEVSVMLTEGHIDGHLSFFVDGMLFSGDTLFAGGCGYLFDGPPSKMHASLTRLAALPDDTRVFCAHEYTQDNLRFAYSVEPGNEALTARIRDTWARRARGECTLPSTIGLERATNPFIRTEARELVAHVGQAMGRELESELEVFTATRALKDRRDYRSLGDDALPL